MSSCIQMSFATTVSNLNNFINHLAPSQIKFIFFQADRMDKPLISTLFGKFNNWYIVPGKDVNYCHAYLKSDLVHTISNLRVNKSINSFCPSSHIDFSIHANQKDSLYYNTHLTQYNDGENSFERYADYACNFISGSGKHFGKTQCVNKDNKPLFQIDQVITEKLHLDMIHDFYKASNGFLKDISKSAHREPDGVKTYKNIDIECTAFYEFMNASIFEKLWPKFRHVALNVYMYFDQDNELDVESGNKSIQYIIEFEENRVVAFAVSRHRALKACWTDLNKSEASMREKRSLAHWTLQCKEFLRTDFYA